MQNFSVMFMVLFQKMNYRVSLRKKVTASHLSNGILMLCTVLKAKNGGIPPSSGGRIVKFNFFTT